MSDTCKLVSVIRKDDQELERRQLPLEVDNNLSLVLQFGDTCIGCNEEIYRHAEMQLFVERQRLLNNDEKSVALIVTRREFMVQVAQQVSCVGCRRSVEQMFNCLVTTRHPALEPIVITSNDALSIKREVLFDPKSMYALFYIHGAQLENVIESIPKSKKHKRCNLHSLDSHTQKTRSLSIWQEIWSLLSMECQEEIVLVDYDSLMATVENYLRKHRFCTECKAKVLRAYSLLRGDELDPAKDKSYQQNIYEGLRCCPSEGHVHVATNVDFMTKLLERAEPELSGSRRERHAKTLDVAQEEVLICLGIHLYERLFKVYQKVRAEEQTWKILFYLGVDALRKKFEVALEAKQGISKLERTCLELLEEERCQKLSRELKKQQKKKKKKQQNNSKAILPAPPKRVMNGDTKSDDSVSGEDYDDADVVHHCKEDLKEKPHRCADEQKSVGPSRKCEKKTAPKALSPCRCDENTNLVELAGGGGGRECVQHQQCVQCTGKLRDRTNNQGGFPTGLSGWLCKHCSSPSSSTSSSSQSCNRGDCNRSDCGYSSASEGSCENCSNSGAGSLTSDLGFPSGNCELEGDSSLCLKDECCSMCDEVDLHHHCREITCKEKCDKEPTHLCAVTVYNGGGYRKNGVSTDYGLSLEHLLQEGNCDDGDDDEYAIPEEEVQQFIKNNATVQVRREKLREQLKMRFANMALQPKDIQMRPSNSHCD